MMSGILAFLNKPNNRMVLGLMIGGGLVLTATRLWAVDTYCGTHGLVPASTRLWAVEAKCGKRENVTARLEETLTAYRKVLTLNTRQRVPLEWAAAQHKLGSVLQALGERESGTVHLEEAVTAYRE